MNNSRTCLSWFWLPAIALIALKVNAQPALSSNHEDATGSQQNLPTHSKKTTLSDSKAVSRSTLSTTLNSNTYILGPGDSIHVELLYIPEYSGTFTIGPDGTIYLPRLRTMYVEGLTISELRIELTKQFNEFVKDPQVFVSPVSYRPIRVYVNGEVKRPGYYYLSSQIITERQTQPTSSAIYSGKSENDYSNTMIKGYEDTFRLPTIFDAIRNAGGVTPYSKLNQITVTRKLPISSGSKRIRANVSLLGLLKNGDENQNIRLVDGDSVFVGRSEVELREQIIKASQTNLSPDFIEVYVTGRVREPGAKVLPQGTTLDNALAAAGGQKLLRGQIEFVRFNRNGSTDKRKFFLSASNPAGSYKNPILMPGDIVRVNDSPISATATVLREITSPAIGVYSILNLLN